jgi:hypothetical protein
MINYPIRQYRISVIFTYSHYNDFYFIIYLLFIYIIPLCVFKFVCFTEKRFGNNATTYL